MARQRAAIIGGIGSIITTGWVWANATISIVNLPADANEAWRVLVSAPILLPTALTVLCLSVLLWALFWPSPIEQIIDVEPATAQVQGRDSVQIGRDNNGTIITGGVHNHGRQPFEWTKQTMDLVVSSLDRRKPVSILVRPSVKGERLYKELLAHLAAEGFARGTEMASNMTVDGSTVGFEEPFTISHDGLAFKGSIILPGQQVVFLEPDAML